MRDKGLRSPQEKKRLSLERDRRNAHGENDKASRKNIPRSKAKSHRVVRRKAAEMERRWQTMAEADAQSAELTATTPRLQKGKFRKWPDTPLGKVVVAKLARRRSDSE